MNFEENFDFRSFYGERDAFYWDEIEKITKKYNIPLEVILKNYMAFIQRRDLPQLLAYYDLLKKVQHLPGSIVEVGVFIGNGLFTWSKLLETFFPGNRGKKVFGFDNFNGYEQEITKYDTNAIEYIKSFVGDFKIDYDFVKKLESLHNLDSMVPGVERVKIYNGSFDQTFQLFKKQNYGVRLKLLVVDVNLYIPTKKALDSFYDLLVPGGIVVFRGYGVKPWEGESQAVDEFMKEKDIKEMHSFDFSMYPALYLIKEEF
jgi:hypothetical protein